MKGIIKYIHDDFKDWMSDPLYHGGIWEDILVAIITILLLVGFIAWAS